MPSSSPFKKLLLLASFFLVTAFSVSCQNGKKPFKTSDSFLRRFPGPVGYVNDFANTYSDSAEKVLDSMITAFEKKTGIEIALVTFDSAMAMPEGVDSLTVMIGNAWGVGKKGKNNGIVIGICPPCRKMRIQNGKGIAEMMSDAETKEIIDNSFIPFFKKNDYFSGTLTGIKDLETRLAKKLKIDF